MTARVEPERELVRRMAPFGGPAAVLALLIGAAAGGWGVGWSAGLGVAVVTLNFVANGLALAWAARISLVALAGAAMGGFVVRMGVIVAMLFVLNGFGWFSPLAFGLAVVPATIMLLAFEMRLLSSGLGQGLTLTARGLPPEPKKGMLR
jgi:hypothetical protein